MSVWEHSMFRRCFIGSRRSKDSQIVIIDQLYTPGSHDSCLSTLVIDLPPSNNLSRSKFVTRCNVSGVGTTWGAHFDVLQTSTTALAFAPAEYCSPVWCRSAHTHRLDAALTYGLRLVPGCIRSTPAFMLPVVSGIMLPDIRRNKQCLALSRRAEADDQHALHNLVTASTPGRKRLQSGGVGHCSTQLAARPAV